MNLGPGLRQSLKFPGLKAFAKFGQQIVCRGGGTGSGDPGGNLDLGISYAGTSQRRWVGAVFCSGPWGGEGWYAEE